MAGKRPAEDEPIESAPAQKRSKDSANNNQGIIEIEAPSAAAQVADYAAEAMYNCFGRNHVVNLLVTGMPGILRHELFSSYSFFCLQIQLSTCGTLIMNPLFK